MLKINTGAQVTIEFTLCMVVAVLLVYALIRAIAWIGIDISERRSEHDKALTVPIVENWTNVVSEGPFKQMTPDFYRTKSLNMVFNEW